MNGITVVCSNATEEGVLDQDKYPTIEEEEENIKKLI